MPAGPARADGLARETIASADVVSGDITRFLWLLKLGGFANLYFLAMTPWPFAPGVDPYIAAPAMVFFAVSAFRCFFPVRYEHHVVFHDLPISSIFWTRVAATFSEILYIFQFSHVLRVLNVEHVGWIDGLSWVMVAAVSISQCFVWSAVFSENFKFYYFEEFGWVVLFAANTIASLHLYLTTGAMGAHEMLLQLSLLYAVGYLPVQIVHLAMLRGDWKTSDGSHWAELGPSFTARLACGLARALGRKRPRTDLESWGGIVGACWMAGYFATIIPIWVYVVVRSLAVDS